MAWTLEQQQAIDLEGKNIIVSAGAGSGKTAVLTARVLRKLQSGIHINQLLILTFTNAAAAEMKDRIRKSIGKTPGLEEELNLLEGAYITTFDSFSLSLVKKYHTRLNITKNIKIADQVGIELQKKKILDTIFDEHYLSPKKEFSKLIHDFCLKDDEELKKYLLNCYQKIELKYNKKEYLENYFAEFNNQKIDSFIKEYILFLKKKQKMLQEAILSLNEYFDGDFIGKVEDNFKGYLNADTYEDFLKGSEYTSITVPRGSGEEAKAAKKLVFDLANEIKELCIYSSEEEMKEEINSTQDSIKVIIEILKELDQRLETFKFQTETFNFNDISRLAIQVVLDNPDIREELTNEFQEILVDEYQDTSDTQEMFISLISHQNVYMVGDIKQSIYRFRNANPYIFKNKYDSYKNKEGGEKIDLVKNFRSREEVLDNINLIFDCFMDDDFGGANYKESHRMVFGNTSYQEEGHTTQNYQMDILTYEKENLGKIKPSEEEAFIIGHDILDKIKNHYQVFDKDLKVLRNIEYKDFVILLDRGRDFDLYKKIFEFLGIPLTILKDESLTKEDDILVIKNLLELLICIKEKTFDTKFRYAFTSVSRSFLYPTNDNEIYEYFVKDNFIDSPLYIKCSSLIEKMDSMSFSRYLIYILNEFQYEEKLLTIGKIDYFRTRLEYLYRLCGEYEERGKTIYDFVSYLNEILEGDYDLSFNISTDNMNSTRIMTIHKSKGLEFPICYFAGLSSKFNMDEVKEKICFDNHYGFILPKVEEYYKDTILKVLLKKQIKQEEISERIRLFYVALTRAKEKMIFVIPKQEEKELIGEVPIYQKENYASFLGILQSIYSVLLPFIKESEIIGNKDYLKMKEQKEEIEKQGTSIKVEELNLPRNIIERKHYSKESLHLVTKEEKQLLEQGTLIHKVLEEMDFLKDDMNIFPVNDFVKKKIISFIQSDFMKDKLSMKMYKEYEFVTENTHGVIDLLLEDEDKMIIIDYKLKNIDDSSYDKQLNGYRKFIEAKGKKKVFCYLYSILDEKVREIVYNENKENN